MAMLKWQTSLMEPVQGFSHHTVGGNGGKTAVIVFERSLWLLCVFH